MKRDLSADVRVYPPPAARRLADEALKVRSSLPPSRRGGLTTQQAGKLGIGSGVARARDIVAGKSLDARQLRHGARNPHPAGSRRALRGGHGGIHRARAGARSEAMEKAARKAVGSVTP
jgi:hypothetical protein